MPIPTVWNLLKVNPRTRRSRIATLQAQACNDTDSCFHDSYIHKGQHRTTHRRHRSAHPGPPAPRRRPARRREERPQNRAPSSAGRAPVARAATGYRPALGHSGRAWRARGGLEQESGGAGSCRACYHASWTGARRGILPIGTDRAQSTGSKTHGRAAPQGRSPGSSPRSLRVAKVG